MKRKSTRSCLLLIGAIAAMPCLKAQTPDDALRAGWFVPGGSARNMAVGGAMGSLGGDITATHVNPAGLGFYKTREIVLSPGFIFNSNKGDFRDSSMKGPSKSAFAYGPIGIVLGSGKTRRSNWSSSAFALSVSQLASYNNRVSYSGYNNMTSFSEQYLEELKYDNADTIAAYNNYVNGASLAYATYLINHKFDGNGNFDGYQSAVYVNPITNVGVFQDYTANTWGGMHEVSLGLGGGIEDRLYFGGSLNVPIQKYHREITYRETDATGNNNNDFGYFEYQERFNSSGVGLNAKLGFIYKPKEFIRIGMAFHTPSVMSIKDELSASITTNTENLFPGNPVATATTEGLNNGRKVTRNYGQVTPYRVIASGSYVFREVENTQRQRAFVTADIEFINHRGSRFFASEDDAEYSGAKEYYRMANDAIKDYLKGAFNFRLGGELKFDPWMFRLGGAYYGSPYKDKELKAHRIMASGGIGYRNHGIFIDLTYAHTFNKDVNFPYRLNDKPNTFAKVNNNRGNLILTVGFKI
ncbi:OmpP1/FadL family transporter [Filimonas effusa]|uniref:Aromatic hydrocarbon degradation protein n=1 Tax=Filimonas effusa TaxID=2508721 RepID=A0A4Q1D8D2_9BACT|nr:hypothetical protein [Filimonas effusa]RXK85460.1 hypothetical protein ESB13_01150 [Filimonas effusa]